MADHFDMFEDSMPQANPDDSGSQQASFVNEMKDVEEIKPEQTDPAAEYAGYSMDPPSDGASGSGIQPEPETVTDTQSAQENVRELPPAQDIVRDMPPAQETVRDMPPAQDIVRDIPPVQETVRDVPPAQDAAGNTQPAQEPAGIDKKASRPSKPKKQFSLKDWVPGPQFPNQLTIARVCMIPLFVIFVLWVPKPAGDIIAMIIFIIACLTDTADGYIARRYNYVTNFGKFMDPLADKLLVCSALICLVDLGRIDSWIVIIIIAREFIISGFRLVAVEHGVVIAANIWGKIKTVVQMLMVILMVGNFTGFLGTVAQILMWLALALTIISLATYLYQNRHVLQENA